ncbi:MAG TPA: flagellar hook capping FlgD N-terminal domain-containing protein [Isosphaeraceae bacterium]|nr:flagellar hook capping FlgD N-terminal domain-containing protein [Isosphaeraceae bacterium]
MTIQATAAAATAGAAGATTQIGGSQLGKQEFLQLLVAQLRNQDPLQPVDNTQFIAQLAQFSTLETLQQIETTMESSLGAQLLDHAVSLLGRQVTATGPDGQTVTGTVQSVHLQGTDVLLDLGSATVHLSDIQAVQATTSNGG